MSNSPLSAHLKYQASGDTESMGILIFKPDCPLQTFSGFRDYCDKNQLNILDERNIQLTRDIAIALYPKIFSYSTDDLQHGIEWKRQVIKYLTSAPCTCFLIEGRDVQNKLTQFKDSFREQNGKITHPKYVMSPTEFYEKVIKNLVHVVDKHELQNCLWLLFERD